MSRYEEIKDKLNRKKINKYLNTKNLSLLNEIVDSKLRYQYNGGIAVERTRQLVRTTLKIKLYNFEISETTYLALCAINEGLATNNYR